MHDDLTATSTHSSSSASRQSEAVGRVTIVDPFNDASVSPLGIDMSQWSRFRTSFANVTDTKEAEAYARDFLEEILGSPLSSFPQSSSSQTNGKLDLRLLLQDGTILVKFINGLWPGAIPKYYTKPQNHFHSLDNLHKVGKALEDNGISRRDVFRPSDLKEPSNFGRVVDCILSVAQLHRKQNETAFSQPFSPDSNTLRSSNNATSSHSTPHQKQQTAKLNADGLPVQNHTSTPAVAIDDPLDEGNLTDTRGARIINKPRGESVLNVLNENKDDSKGKHKPAIIKNRRSVFAETPDLANLTEPMPVYPKDERARELIANALRANFLFSNLQNNDEQIQQVVDSMFPVSVRQGETIIRQGENGDHFYVVDSGEFEIFVKRGDDPPKRVSEPGQFAAGSSFGELALMYNTPRASTVTAVRDSKLWALERKIFRRIVVDISTTKQHQKTKFVMDVPLFASLNKWEQSQLATAMEERTYADGERIIRQGDIGLGFFIVFKGKCVVTIDGDDDPKVVYQPGDYFGERALLSNEPRAANVTAIEGPCTCLCLSRHDFVTLLGPLRDLMKRKATVESGREIVWADEQKNHEVQEPVQQTPVPSSKVNIKFDELIPVQLIGAGSFGTVQMVRHAATSKTFALKTVSKAHIVRTGQTKHVMSEKNVMAAVDHPFLVNLISTYQDTNCLYFLTELCLGGELMYQLKKHDHFDEDTARFYAASVVLALEHLQSKNIVYRDLKPENLLLDGDGYLKMTDFGFTKMLSDGEMTYTLCGTPDYLAPEVLDNSGHNKAVDWWSFGILVFEMLAGYPPFYNENPWTTYKNIKAGNIEYPEHFSEAAVDLVSKLLEPKQTLRLGVIKGGVDLIKRHEWFQSINWDDLLHKRVTPPIRINVSGPEDASYFADFDASILEEMDLFPEYGDRDSSWSDGF